MKVSAAETLDLPVSERIQLVTEIWDSIAEFPNEIELTPSTRKLLAKRLQIWIENLAADGSPDDATSWDQIEVDGIMKQFFTEDKVRSVAEDRFDLLSLEKMTTHRYGKPKQLLECLARSRS